MITGHLQEKSGRYYMVLNLYVDGKWKPKWISTKLAIKGNKRNAEAMLHETIAKYESGELDLQNCLARSKSAATILELEKSDTPTDPSDILFTQYMANWLKLIRHQIESSTYLGYKQVVEQRVIPYFEPLGLKLREVEAKHIKTYYDYLQVELKVTGNTVKHHHANIRKALQSAVIGDLIPTNPADKVEKPRIKPHVADIYNRDELNALFEATKGRCTELPVLIAAYYGLRNSEVCGLRWDAIDFEGRTITIKHIISKGEDENGKQVIIKRNRPKNKSSFRTLPLIPLIEDKLLERKAQADEWRQMYRRAYSTEHIDYVFTGRLGALLIPGNLTHYFSKLLAENNLRHIRFHDLRHSCASLLLANGISMKEIQDWLGHSSYSTTANIYAHLDSNSKNESARVIANVLGGNEATKQVTKKSNESKKQKEPARTKKSA